MDVYNPWHCTTNYFLNMTNEVDHAWAAGLFEGEGSFDHSAGNAHRPRATMSLTDKDILERFMAAVGAGTMGPSKRRAAHHKEAWQWWTNEAEFHIVYAAMKPWLGLRRVAAAEAAIKARSDHIAASIAPRRCICCGTTFTPSAFTKGSRKQNRCSAAHCQLFRQSAMRKSDMAVIRGIAQPTTF